MLKFAKILLTVIAFIYGLAPLIADISQSHVLNDHWPGHARFHTVWLLAITALLSLLSLNFIWRKSADHIHNLKFASVIGIIILTSFMIALLTLGSYGGALADPDHQIKILSFDANVFVFSCALVLQIIATIIVWRVSE